MKKKLTKDQIKYASELAADRRRAWDEKLTPIVRPVLKPAPYESKQILIKKKSDA
jgi:hypothetical protein